MKINFRFKKQILVQIHGLSHGRKRWNADPKYIFSGNKHKLLSPTSSPPSAIILQASLSHARSSQPALPSSIASTFQSLRLSCPRRPTRWPGALRRSISQVYSYGNVDYERRPPLSWHALYGRILIIGGRGRGAAAVLEAWVGEGRRLSKWELAGVVKELRKFRCYKFSLQVQFSLVT